MYIIYLLIKNRRYEKEEKSVENFNQSSKEHENSNFQNDRQAKV